MILAPFAHVNKMEALVLGVARILREPDAVVTVAAVPPVVIAM